MLGCGYSVVILRHSVQRKSVSVRNLGVPPSLTLTRSSELVSEKNQEAQISVKSKAQVGNR